MRVEYNQKCAVKQLAHWLITFEASIIKLSKHENNIEDQKITLPNYSIK